MATPTFHVAMFPWFAMGHITPYLHLSNKLAERGCKISFLIPTNTQSKLQHLNYHPNLITFIPLTIPCIEGLPDGAETMADIPTSMAHLLGTAMDLIEPQIQATLNNIKPHFVFSELAHWLVKITHSLGIKYIHFSVVSACSIAHHYVPMRKGKKFIESEVMDPPPGYPSPSLQIPIFFARRRVNTSNEFGIGISFFDRLVSSFEDCDAICFRGCREIEGPYFDYLESQYKKQILVTGPVLYNQSDSPLEEKWDKWLSGFGKGSVVYCAFGSEFIMEKVQFQELVMGLELTGLPFMLVSKPPFGSETVEEALPEGFIERVQGRGVVHGGWVQQQLILKHPSVGCFLSHCGFGSMWESLVSDCQIVLLPHLTDQFINSQIMSKELKVAVELERRADNGWFSKEGVHKAVELVMNEESEVANEVRRNHAVWKDVLMKEGLETSYLNNVIAKLQDMLAGVIDQEKCM